MLCIDKIKQDAAARVLKENGGNPEFLLYLDHTPYQKGQTVDLVTKKLVIEQPTLLVFEDDEPGKNFGHRCGYLLYNPDNGEFIKKIPAEFPHFMRQIPQSLELFKSSSIVDQFLRKKKMTIPLEPATLSAYSKFAPLPFCCPCIGKRFAILYSGSSNGRHVNDLEFLYRTLLDVYGFLPENIYVLNYDGTVNYNQMPWETPPGDGFGADGTPWRIVVNGEGNRAGFQGVIANLKTRICSQDFLFIHTNNHGGWDSTQNDGLLSAYGGVYYAKDFAADLAQLPPFKVLLVAMEQCNSGSFSQPIIDNSPAVNTVFQAAVPWDQSSAGGWPFDPWAEMWISAVAGVRGDGSALVVSPDDDLNSRISAWEAYDYAISIDNPVMAETSENLSKNVYLTLCSFKTIKETKEYKETKEFKETKEWKEYKEPKEFKETKEYKEPKEFKETKEIKETKEPKEFKETKEYKEPKEYYEGKVTDTVLSNSQPVQTNSYSVEQRVTRLESAVSDLTPFIQQEERPSLKSKVAKTNQNNKE